MKVLLWVDGPRCLCQLMSAFRDRLKIDITMDFCKNEEMFYEYINKKSYDIVLIEENKDKQSIIEYAYYIRQRQMKSLIYCLCHQCYDVQDCFILSRYQIFLKENLLDLKEDFYHIIKNKFYKTNICFHTSRGDVWVDTGSIMNIHFQKDYFEIVCLDGKKYEGFFIDKKKVFDDLFDRGFVLASIHDFVNLEWVERMHDKKIQFVNGHVVKVLEGYRKGILEVFEKSIYRY